MYDDLGDVGGLGDVGEEGGGTSFCIAVVNEAPDEACEAEGDMDGGEAEHEDGDREDHRGDLARAAEAHDVDIGQEEAEVDAY